MFDIPCPLQIKPIMKVTKLVIQENKKGLQYCTKGTHPGTHQN